MLLVQEAQALVGAHRKSGKESVPIRPPYDRRMRWLAVELVAASRGGPMRRLGGLSVQGVKYRAAYLAASYTAIRANAW